MEENMIEIVSQQLLDDLIINILLKLPAKSIGRFRCVSKGWLYSTSNSSFLLEHTRHSPNSILLQTFKHQFNFLSIRHLNLQLLPPLPDIRLLETPRSMKDIVIASCDGMLCLCSRRHGGPKYKGKIINFYYILNPLTGTQIDVPMPNYCIGSFLGFYYHPSTREYRFIRRANSNFDFTMFEMISLDGVVRGRTSFSSYISFMRARAPIVLNGMLYWIAYTIAGFMPYKILSFDSIKEEFNLLPLPSHNIHCLVNAFLVDMGKRLCFSNIDTRLGYLGELAIEIWVLKDFEIIQWEKIYSSRCITELGRINFWYRNHFDDIAVCINIEEIVILFRSSHLYLVTFNLKHRTYHAMHMVDHGTPNCHISLLYKESLVSHDSFLNN